MHIGIILDGNRRFAKKNKLLAFKGHEVGAKKVEELISWSKELGIKELTLYAFSIENFNRSNKEKEVLFDLFRKSIAKIEKELKNEKLNFIGRLDLFPEDMYEAMIKTINRTKDNNGIIVNLAMGYGGRTEIVDAVKKIATNVKNGKIEIKDIDKETVTKNLYLSSEPDLIIRPGGEKRVSNFLIWQGYYSEWYFCDKLWPEFEKEDIMAAIDDFNNRERRFGK
jgi:tritrans,polycis-undecaprenyl-diphosphate synthase [geranylgeranyl-diphosphate specific]